VAYRIYEGLNAIFELKGPFAKLVTAERKAIVRASLRQGGEFFKEKYIPLRFTDYAYRLGYRVTEEWKKFKRRVMGSKRANPYIGTTAPGGGDVESMYSGLKPTHNPEKMAIAMQRGCRVDVTGTGAGGNIIIRTPYGHPILPVSATAFTKIAPAENQKVAQEVARAFTAFLAYARTPGGRSKKLTITGATDHWTPRGSGTIKARDTSVTFRKT
jgi:hypothetical protein